MKIVNRLLMMLGTLMLLLPALCYGQQYQYTAPDCEFSFRFAVVNGVITAPSRVPAQPAQVGPVTQVTAGYDNRYKNCVSWTMVYHVDGPTSPSIELDEAPTSGGVPGSWFTWPAISTAPGTSQPLTAASFSQVSVFTYFPWISVVLNSASGSGQIEGHVYGWRAAPGQDASTTGTTVISRFNPAPAQSSSNSQQVPLTSSATGAASAANVTLFSAAGKTLYLTGFQITGGGATAASIITVTVTGTVTGTMNYNIVVPAGATTSITPLIVSFPIPVPASAVNTNITINVPSFGAGNTNSAVSAQGFQSN